MNGLVFFRYLQKRLGLGIIPLVVAAQTVGSAAYGESMAAPSVVRAESEALLSSQISGRIVALPFKEGDGFRAGEVLVDIDCAILDFEATAAAAESLGKAAVAQSREALFARGGGSQLDVRAAQAEATAAAARADAAKQRVQYCRITAPYDGRIVEKTVNVHELVEPGKPLLAIVSTGKPDLEIIAPAEWLAWVRPGVAGTLTLEATRKVLSVEVRAIAPAVDPVSRTVTLSAILLGEVNGVLPGMSGIVALERPQ